MSMQGRNPPTKAWEVCGLLHAIFICASRRFCLISQELPAHTVLSCCRQR